jgi:hypothetical protein
MRTLGDGQQLNIEPRRTRLPSHYKKEGEMKVWSSGGAWIGEPAHAKVLPDVIRPATTAVETNIITCLLQELRSKLTLDLDPSPTYERGLGNQSKIKQSVDYLVVGSSNAAKLADAIADRGYSVHKIYYPNWRVDADNVEELLKMVREAIEDKDPGTIVYQMLDNSCYYGRLRDGSRTAAKLGADGNYHLEGEVTVCSKDTQLEHLNSIKPLLELAAKKKCLLLTPLPRYVAAGCCTNPEHCSNRRYPDFMQHMRDALELLRKHFKDFLYYRNMRHIKILDPGMDIRGLSLEEKKESQVNIKYDF